MRRIVHNLLWTLAAILAIGVSLNATSVGSFADDEGCSAATLNGSYGIETTGSIVAFGPVGPVAEAGIIRFDGVGKVWQSTTVSLNGTIIPNRTSISGVYQVNQDCTGDLALVLPAGPGVTITSALHFVVVDNGKEIRLVNVGAGRVLVSNARKQIIIR